MLTTFRTGILWPHTPCKMCSRIIHPADPAIILSCPNEKPVLLCEPCGQVIATESDPTRLLQYLDLFADAGGASPPRTPPTRGELRPPLDSPAVSRST